MSDTLNKYRMAANDERDALKGYRAASADQDIINALAKYLGITGYLDRQGKMAQGGLDWANKGFEKVRGGDPLGLLDELGGIGSWLVSPATALVPTRDEIAVSQTPEWAKPIMSGAAQSALFALPGPDLGPAASTAGRALRGAREQAQIYADDFAQKFGADIPAGAEVYGSGPVIRKPLGTNLSDLMAGGEAERAALKARFDGEVANANGRVTHKFYVQGKEYVPPQYGSGNIDESWASHIAGDVNPLQEVRARIAGADTAEERAMWERIAKKFQTGEFAVLGPDGTPALGSPRMMAMPQGGYQAAPPPPAPPPEVSIRDLMRFGDGPPVDTSGYVPDPRGRLRVKMPGDDARYDVPSVEEILANQAKDRALLGNPKRKK